MTERKKSGLAFWAVVVLVVALVAYPLSFGPACWFAIAQPAAATSVGYFYWPLTRIAWACPEQFLFVPLAHYALWRQPGFAIKTVAGVMCVSKPH